MKLMKGEVAVVTGGGAGIGEALCLELASRDACIVVADVNEEAARRVAGSIEQAGGRAQSVRLDVSKEIEVAHLVEQTIADYGRLDYMFNNAGIAIGGDVRDLNPEQWRQVLAVDLSGVIHGTLAAYSVMVKQGFGHIVNTASATGLMPQPGNAPYCTAKHGIVGLSLALRFEGADLGVKVSVVCPGNVRTTIYRNMVVANVTQANMAAYLAGRREMEAARAARLIMDGVARNRAVIIFPTSVRWVWYLYRLVPRLLDRAWLGRIRRFRKYRGTSPG